MKTVLLFAIIGLSGCRASTEWDDPHDPESENFTIPFHLETVPEGAMSASSVLELEIFIDDDAQSNSGVSFRCTLNDQPCANDPISIYFRDSKTPERLSLYAPTLGLQKLRLQSSYENHLARDVRELSWTRVPIDTTVSFVPDPYGGVVSFQCQSSVENDVGTFFGCGYSCSVDGGPFADCATLGEGPDITDYPYAIKAIDIFDSVTATYVLSVAASVEGALDPTPAKITIDCVQYGKEYYDFFCSGPGDEPFNIGQLSPSSD